MTVGGGATGLAAARNNVPVRVVKKEPQHRWGQRGAGVQSSTSYAFRRFTIWEPTATIPYYNPKLVGQPTLQEVICEHLTPSS
ncbi:hypothetical protein EDD15DRAFT_2288370 [Pisolithus albus]|nr:hypothetical protein EDD15DRAFT_2288370 [Pisolithus albus]